MKHEWRRLEKKYYMPGERAEKLTVPAFRFIVLNGTGAPESDEFAARVEALYAVSSEIREIAKSDASPEDRDYAIYPLEGLWTLEGEWDGSRSLDKSRFRYELMIRQPDFVTDDIISLAVERVSGKAGPGVLRELEIKSIEDGSSVQILHTGSYDDVLRSFGLIRRFLWDNGLERTSLTHREIYLNNPARTAPEALQTVLRIGVRSITQSDR